MNPKRIVLAALVAASANAVAQAPDEAACRKQVDATVEAMQAHAKQTGVEQKFHDLTVQKIEDVRKERGDCAALAEINRRKQHY